MHCVAMEGGSDAMVMTSWLHDRHYFLIKSLSVYSLYRLLDCTVAQVLIDRSCSSSWESEVMHLFMAAVS